MGEAKATAMPAAAHALKISLRFPFVRMRRNQYRTVVEVILLKHPRGDVTDTTCNVDIWT